jgi:hypothetical protein
MTLPGRAWPASEAVRFTRRANNVNTKIMDALPNEVHSADFIQPLTALPGTTATAAWVYSGLTICGVRRARQ